MICNSTNIARAAEPGDVAIVVFNSKLKESKAVAEHYARARGVPARQVFGFDLPEAESITRAEFRDQLQEPLLRRLESDRLFVFAPETESESSETTNARAIKPIRSRIRYAVLCYGVPLKIQNDPALAAEAPEKLRAEMRRTDAAVDSELALLPLAKSNLPLYGPRHNWTYGSTNAARLHPTNGILMVARLDGPSSEIARGLVDKARQAERDGLWGRAYFDARGLTNTSYLRGDTWIRAAAEVASRVGFETVLDDEPATFSAAFPLSHVALYAGWYDGGVSGPFARAKVEFMPGAIAYHLHSYSAATVRSASSHWVGPLLDRGATATMGCVEEPYLEGTPDLAVFFARLIFQGFSFGEAAYACQNSLSWQTTVVGDPLYRPFQRHPLELHADLEKARSKLVEWSVLRAMNQNVRLGERVTNYISVLESVQLTRESAVLLEKLGDLYLASSKPAVAVEKYQRALEQGPSPQQQLRLLLTLGKTWEAESRPEEASATYQRLLKTFPDYADAVTIYKKLVALAEAMGNESDKQRYQQELDRLLGTAPKSAEPKF